MRTLSKKQKDYLTKLASEKLVMSTDYLSLEEQEELTDMNDHECLHQNADRFLGDLHFKKLYGDE